jgi:hypothetical protein
MARDSLYRGPVIWSVARRLAIALPRGLMLGFGTIFQPKTNADDHWSVSPKVVIVDDGADEDSGAPPRPRELPSSV